MPTNTGLPIPGVTTTDPGMSSGGGGNGLQQIIDLITKATANRNPTRPGVDGMITNTSAMPGANIPMPTKQRPNLQRMPDTHNKNVEFGTLMGNVGEIVQTAEKNHEAKKTRELQVDLERVIIASQNPSDPQNAQVLNDIMNDSKKRKAIGEALGINFMGEEDKRKPWQKQAVAGAQAKVKAQINSGSQGGAPAAGNNPTASGGGGQGGGAPLNAGAQKLLSSLPRGPQLSPQYQVLAQAVKDGLIPSADVEATQQGQDGRAMLQAATKLQVTQALIQAHGDDAKTKAASELLKTYAQMNGKKEAAKILASAQKYKADQMLKGVIFHATKMEEAANGRISKLAGDKDTQNDIKAAVSELNGARITAQMIIARKQAGDGFDKDAYNKAANKARLAMEKLDKLGVQIPNDTSSNTGGKNGGAINDTGSGEQLESSIIGNDKDTDQLFNDYNSIVGETDDAGNTGNP